MFGSTDIQIIEAGLLGSGHLTEDFGHIDIWTAPEAIQLIWQPLLEWIEGHTTREVDPHPLMATLSR